MERLGEIDGKTLGKMKLERILKKAFFIAKKFYVAELSLIKMS